MRGGEAPPFRSHDSTIVVFIDGPSAIDATVVCFTVPTLPHGPFLAKAADRALPPLTTLRRDLCGFIGSYFKYELDEGKDLKAKYRVFVQPGEMTLEEAAARAADFVNPVKVECKAL